MVSLEQFVDAMNGSVTATQLADNQLAIFQVLGCRLETTTTLNLVLEVLRFWDEWLPASGFAQDPSPFLFLKPGKQPYANFRIALALLDAVVVEGVQIIDCKSLLLGLMEQSLLRASPTISRDIMKYLRVFVSQVLEDCLAFKLPQFGERESEQLEAVWEGLESAISAPSNENCKTYQEYLCLQTFPFQGKK